ncbi:T9SS type A sorting domain-containing protein, partial [Mariniflexile jejuense]
TCTVTDSNGCSSSQSFTVTQPTALVATATSQTNISCNGGSNGSATVSVSGGTPGYTYTWSPSGGTSATATGLAAGTYTVTVTDANSCQTIQSFTLTQPTALVATATSQTNISCNGGSNGSATVTASGGAGGYTYSWAPSGGTGATATGLSAGVYTVTITDANACTTTKSFTLTQPSAISVTPASQTNISCFAGSNGTASVNTPTGGSGGYTYNWTPGNPTGDGTKSVTGLTAGTWSCTVTDSNGCSTSQSFTLTQPASSVSATISSQTNVTCNGGTDGILAVTATGGIAPYTYLWSNSATTATITGIIAGTYSVTVTDANGCSSITSATITEPTAMDSTVNQNAAVLTANQTGVLYQWYKCPNILLNNETNQSFTATTNGDYKVVITNASCVVESVCITVSSLSNDTFDNKLKFTMYPNPSNGNIYVKSILGGDFQIINQLGQTVKTFKANINAETIIYVGDLSEGVYYIKARNKINASSKKLIIKK